MMLLVSLFLSLFNSLTVSDNLLTTLMIGEEGGELLEDITMTLLPVSSVGDYHLTLCYYVLKTYITHEDFINDIIHH